MPQFVGRSRDGHIVKVTLNRPEALNAISGAVADEVADAFEDLSSNDEVWVVVLAAEGDKAFCVGADLKERASFTLDDYHANRKQMSRMFRAIRQTPQPTIASVFGFALGGGLELALSCDLIVAAEGTRMGLPEARVGLLPAGGGTQLLTREIGPAKAKELIFAGQRLEARAAADLGLVTKVVPRDELQEATMELARSVCRSSPVSLRQAKRSIDAALGVSLEEGIEIENDAWAVVVASEDRSEGIAAFNAKRDPRWRNR